MSRSKTVYVARVNNLRYNCHFIATNDQTVWKDTPKLNAIRSAIDNKDTNNTVPMKDVSHISWTPVIIEQGFSAHIKDEEQEKYGDTPTEATKYLDFPETYEIDRDPITDSTTLENQIIDIIQYLPGAVHYTTIPNYLNYEEINEQYTSEDILTRLENMSSNVYQTKEGNEWWSVRNN